MLEPYSQDSEQQNPFLMGRAIHSSCIFVNARANHSWAQGNLFSYKLRYE